MNAGKKTFIATRIISVSLLLITFVAASLKFANATWIGDLAWWQALLPAFAWMTFGLIVNIVREFGSLVNMLVTFVYGVAFYSTVSFVLLKMTNTPLVADVSWWFAFAPIPLTLGLIYGTAYLVGAITYRPTKVTKKTTFSVDKYVQGEHVTRQ